MCIRGQGLKQKRLPQCLTNQKKALKKKYLEVPTAFSTEQTRKERNLCPQKRRKTEVYNHRYNDLSQSVVNEKVLRENQHLTKKGGGRAAAARNRVNKKCDENWEIEDCFVAWLRYFSFIKYEERSMHQACSFFSHQFTHRWLASCDLYNVRFFCGVRASTALISGSHDVQSGSRSFSAKLSRLTDRSFKTPAAA